ncbi:endonuclease SmrB [Rheinheimera hassiensis]|uniref:endonuclease SmrB n=1 Tax=Rheinheimera hassiensis TaxID=1193627 RepID=UPI001F06527F|nr:endonuclease SmrB [Rheinheimera hassiensis]
MQKKAIVTSTGISAEDSQLFRESITGAQPIAQDKIPPVAAPRKKKRRTDVLSKQLDENLFCFSDEFEGYVADGASLSWIQSGDDPHLAGRLRRGEFQPQVVLDLHGMTTQQAKTELAGLLAYCEKQQFNCACVVHGKGLGILAKKVPNWLIQHPNVRAFHTAPKSWGKHGALILLLKIAS